MSKILVTGVAGFIGSHLADELVHRGEHVIGLDNLSTGRIENLSNIINKNNFRFVKLDLLLDNWEDKVGSPDIVLHFAANPEVRHSVIEPMSHYEQNLTATMRVLEFARHKKVDLVVFASSSTVYGDPDKIPTPEDHPLKPISIYGATKASAEIMCQTYARLYGIKCLILRYANIIGPRLRHGVIYDFIMKLRKNPHELEILGDGSQRKSYLWIEDAVDATLKLIDHAMSRKEKVLIYNVGNEDWTSVKEIAEAVIEVLNIDNVKFVYVPGTSDGRGWPGDVKFMLLDIRRLKEDLGWRPKYTSIEAVKMTARSLVKEIWGR
jgi:UDP-glucose 4-epimerase